MILGHEVTHVTNRHAQGRRDPRHGEEDLLVSRVSVELESVAVRHVRHLVAEDHRQLGLVLKPAEQPRVHVHLAVGHGEGVEGGVLQHDDPHGGSARLPRLLRHQLGGHAREILLEQRVVPSLAKLGELLLLPLGVAPELSLVGRRPVRLALIAHGRDVGRGAAREQRNDEDPGQKFGGPPPAAVG